MLVTEFLILEDQTYRKYTFKGNEGYICSQTGKKTKDMPDLAIPLTQMEFFNGSPVYHVNCCGTNSDICTGPCYDNLCKKNICAFCRKSTRVGSKAKRVCTNNECISFGKNRDDVVIENNL